MDGVEMLLGDVAGLISTLLRGVPE